MLCLSRNSVGVLALGGAFLAITVPVACGGDETSNPLVVTGSTDDATSTSSDSQTATGMGGSTLSFMAGPMTGTGGDMSVATTVAATSTGSGEGGTGNAVYSWDFTFGGTNATDQVTTYDVAVDNVGDIVVVGSFSGSIDFDGNGSNPPVNSNGGFDAYIAKFTNKGVLKWVRTAGGPNPENTASVSIDKDGRVGACGTFRGTINFGGNNLSVNDSQYSDLFAVVFDSAGNHIASQSYGGNTLGKSDLCAGAAFDPVGNLVITGQSQGAVNFGSGTAVGQNDGDFKLYVAKLAPNAGTKGFQELFAKAFASPGVKAQGRAVAVSTNGEIAVGGYSEGPISLGGVSLTSPFTGIPQAVVARYDSNGLPTFTKMFASEGDAQVTSLKYHTNGDLIVAGVFRKSIDFGAGPIVASGGSNDMFLARFDAFNKLVFGVKFGDSLSDDLNDVAFDAAGFAVAAGSFQGSPKVNSQTTLVNAGSRDAAVLKFAPNDGHGFWGKGFGDADLDEGKAIAVDSLGNVIIAGQFKGTIDLGGGIRIAPNGSQAVFVGGYLP